MVSPYWVQKVQEDPRNLRETSLFLSIYIIALNVRPKYPICTGIHGLLYLLDGSNETDKPSIWTKVFAFKNGSPNKTVGAHHCSKPLFRDGKVAEFHANWRVLIVNTYDRSKPSA